MCMQFLFTEYVTFLLWNDILSSKYQIIQPWEYIRFSATIRATRPKYACTKSLIRRSRGYDIMHSNTGKRDGPLPHSAHSVYYTLCNFETIDLFRNIRIIYRRHVAFVYIYIYTYVIGVHYNVI